MRRILSFCFGAWIAAYAVGENAPLRPFRTEGGRVGFLSPGAASPSGLRVLVDEHETPGGWSEWGIDRMSEGGGVYRYPAGAREWKWDSEGSVVFAARSNELAMILPNVEARGTFRWFAEWYDDQWRVIRRYPSEGIFTNTAGELPPAPPWLDPPLPPIDELLRFAPTSLSRRLQREYLDFPWRAEVLAPLPALTLPDGERAELRLAWTESAMETIDYNPASLAVADYPATFVLADLKPGIAMPIQAVEFTAALAGFLRARGQYLMANFPCWRFPFFMPYIDIPGEETTWYTGRQYTPMREHECNYRRAMSARSRSNFCGRLILRTSRRPTWRSISATASRSDCCPVSSVTTARMIPIGWTQNSTSATVRCFGSICR